MPVLVNCSLNGLEIYKNTTQIINASILRQKMHCSVLLEHKIKLIFLNEELDFLINNKEITPGVLPEIIMRFLECYNEISRLQSSTEWFSGNLSRISTLAKVKFYLLHFQSNLNDFYDFNHVYNSFIKANHAVHMLIFKTDH